ncbi:MAG: nucleotide kinase [Clostridiales bacterium]|nr:nucleotide kinase [Candidatus Cacconaster stercorequi]
MTGAKGVGKSTLLKKLLPAGEIGGFFTVKTDTVYDCLSVHLLRPGETPSPDNLLFFCHRKDDATIAQRFDRLGCTALSVKAPVLVMDELGPTEQNALAFQTAVWQALDGDVPIIGVLQCADTPFLWQVTQHPQVQVVTVTPENRDALAHQFRIQRK